MFHNIVFEKPSRPMKMRGCRARDLVNHAIVAVCRFLFGHWAMLPFTIRCFSPHRVVRVWRVVPGIHITVNVPRESFPHCLKHNFPEM